VPRFAVDVMLKREILDPQGQAVAQALPSLGFDGVSEVRVGKHVELRVDTPAAEGNAEDMVARIAEALLANPVIEEFSVRVLDG
jgi:phosphoribosylformylglycinamidine synthase PurS subunit